MVREQARTQTIPSLQQPLVQGLACAALQPGLRSILVFDSSPAMLETAVGLWAEMLAITTTQGSVQSVYLGPTETEESLWGSMSLDPENKTQPFVWKAGLLGNDSDTRIVVIPDLSRLSLSAARACIALMGTEMAQLERHGHQARWRSQLGWIAGCPRSQIKFLSPHLLDRFALRLSGQEFQRCDRITALRDWFASLETPQTKEPTLPTELCQQIEAAQQQRPDLTDAACKRGLAYFSDGEGLRRELTLLRLAQAQAQLDESNLSKVMPKHVDLAARMIGLKLVSTEPAQEEPTLPESEKPEPEAEAEPFQPESLPDTSIEDAPSQESRSEAPVYKPDIEAEFPSTPVELNPVQEPYPEDHTPTERESASLRLPARRFRKATMGRGPVIGVEPTTVPQDIAWVSTLLEAAKYQAMRTSENGTGLTLQPTDLRRYRRAAVPEQLLTVVLDYTCLKECQWQEALLPYLQWAYIERASVCLVQVGAATAGQELQAQKVSAQSVLVPRVQVALEQGAGLATPLAHGLNLAQHSLRHALQHGRSTVQQAVLVVLSDGRGNVPLEASQTNRKPTYLVNRQGIKDALQEAEQIRRLKQVESVVLNPQPKYYSELPIKLAQALGAKIADIPTLNVWEVEQ
ncbi:Mg-chelatase subunit ChlD [Leptolyngbya sp. PCC 7375]|nr:Mg-chelatase subunit ChlD [Leptolyngbya sp. PCC 7375]